MKNFMHTTVNRFVRYALILSFGLGLSSCDIIQNAIKNFIDGVNIGEVDRNRPVRVPHDKGDDDDHDEEIDSITIEFEGEKGGKKAGDYNTITIVYMPDINDDTQDIPIAFTYNQSATDSEDDGYKIYTGKHEGKQLTLKARRNRVKIPIIKDSSGMAILDFYPQFQ